jgi:hypothetical protein
LFCAKCHKSDQQVPCCTCTYHITICLFPYRALRCSLHHNKSIYAFKDNKAGVLVPFGSIIIVNIKRFNYREHNYVVHNYNAPPTALRKSVGREDNHVCKVGNKIDGGKQSPTGSRVHEKSEQRASCEEWAGYGERKKKVSMQSLCRSLCLLDSARCLSG